MIKRLVLVASVCLTALLISSCVYVVKPNWTDGLLI